MNLILLQLRLEMEESNCEIRIATMKLKTGFCGANCGIKLRVRRTERSYEITYLGVTFYFEARSTSTLVSVIFFAAEVRSGGILSLIPSVMITGLVSIFKMFSPSR